MINANYYQSLTEDVRTHLDECSQEPGLSVEQQRNIQVIYSTHETILANPAQDITALRAHESECNEAYCPVSLMIEEVEDTRNERNIIAQAQWHLSACKEELISEITLPNDKEHDYNSPENIRLRGNLEIATQAHTACGQIRKGRTVDQKPLVDHMQVCPRKIDCPVKKVQAIANRRLYIEENRPPAITAKQRINGFSAAIHSIIIWILSKLGAALNFLANPLHYFRVKGAEVSNKKPFYAEKVAEMEEQLEKVEEIPKFRRYYRHRQQHYIEQRLLELWQSPTEANSEEKGKLLNNWLINYFEDIYDLEDPLTTETDITTKTSTPIAAVYDELSGDSDEKLIYTLMLGGKSLKRSITKILREESSKDVLTSTKERLDQLRNNQSIREILDLISTSRQGPSEL